MMRIVVLVVCMLGFSVVVEACEQVGCDHRDHREPKRSVVAHETGNVSSTAAVNPQYQQYINQNITNVSPVVEADRDPNFKFFAGGSVILWENKRETLAVKAQGKVYPPQNGMDTKGEAGPVVEWNAWKTFTGRD